MSLETANITIPCFAINDFVVIDEKYFVFVNDDKINDNVWQMLYPWKDGDSVIIEPYGWYQDGDAWQADLSVIGKKDDNSKDDLDFIKVVPNPYIVNSDYDETRTSRRLWFNHLPNKCRITIYTISGELVAHITHNDPFDGNEFWNLRTINNQEVAPGLYIYTVEAGEFKHIGKFAVVR